MRRVLKWSAAALAIGVLSGCPSSPGPGGVTDAGTPDGGPTPDSGSQDSGTPDSGRPDSGTPDSGTPDSGQPDGGAWLGAVRVLSDLSHPGSMTASVGDVHVAGDGFGNAIAVWTQVLPDAGTTAPYVLFTSTLRSDAGWTVPMRLDTPDPLAPVGDDNPLVMYPDVAFDGAGNAVASWSQLDRSTGAASLRMARYSAGAGWSPPTVAYAGVSYFPSLAVDSAGTASLAFEQYYPGGAYVVRSFADGGLTGPVLIEATNAYAPRITTSPDGTSVILAYPAVSARLMRVSNLLPDAGWSPAQTVGVTYDGGGASVIQYQLAEAADGTGLLVWTTLENDGVTNRVLASHYAGGVWSPAEDVAGPVPGSSSAPSVSMDSAGNGLATWIQLDGGVPGLRIDANRYTAGSGWGTPAELSSDPNSTLLNQQTIASESPSGEAIAMYSKGAAPGARVYASRWTGAAWAPEQVIDTTDPTFSRVFSPNLYINNQRATACWVSPSSAVAVWAHNTDAANGVTSALVTIYANELH